MQDCSNSSALATELLTSCTKPSIYSFLWCNYFFMPKLKIQPLDLRHGWVITCLHTMISCGLFVHALDSISFQLIPVCRWGPWPGFLQFISSLHVSHTWLHRLNFTLVSEYSRAHAILQPDTDGIWQLQSGSIYRMICRYRNSCLYFHQMHWS